VAAHVLSFRSIVIEDMDDYVNKANSVLDKNGKRMPTEILALTLDS